MLQSHDMRSNKSTFLIVVAKILQELWAVSCMLSLAILGPTASTPLGCIQAIPFTRCKRPTHFIVEEKIFLLLPYQRVGAMHTYASHSTVTGLEMPQCDIKPINLGSNIFFVNSQFVVPHQF
jgi:hypothetical protein